MALFLETIHGDVVIDLNINDVTIQPQVHNALALADYQFLSKLHTFSSPALHFQYSTPNFIFFGDPTYTGKGGQSALSLLNQIDPTNPLASKFSTIRAIDQASGVGGSFSTQQHLTTQRRKRVKDELNTARSQVQDWVRNHPHGRPSSSSSPSPPSSPTILLVSIPHANGEVSSLFGIYCALPAQCWFGGAGDQKTDTNPLLDPIATFPENLYDYVIGTVAEGHDVVYQLFSQARPNPLLTFHPVANTNPFLSPPAPAPTSTSDMNDNNSNPRLMGQKIDHNGLCTTTNTPSLLLFTPKTRGDMILQTVTIQSPFPPLTTPERLQQLVIPHHNQRLVQALRATKQAAFEKTIIQHNQDSAQSSSTISDGPTAANSDGEVINLGSYLKTDGSINVEAEMLFLDSFHYNPKPQHYPTFLKTTAKLPNNGFVPAQVQGDFALGNANAHNHPLSQTTLDSIYRKLSRSGYTVSPVHVDGSSGSGSSSLVNVVVDDYDDDDDGQNGGHGGGDDDQVQIQIRMEEPKNILFVSNLSPNSTKESITTHFSAHTIVLNVDLIRERLGQSWKCYAFIHVSTESQCDSAVTLLNKSTLDGYTINVGYCHGTGNAAITGGDIYFTVHTDQSHFFSKRPKRTTLASSIVAGGGAGTLGAAGSGGK